MNEFNLRRFGLAGPDLVEREGDTLEVKMFKACARGDTEAAALSIDQGADPLAEDTKAVGIACAFGHVSVTSLLESKGVPVNDLGNLVVASARGHRPAVEFLLDKVAFCSRAKDIAFNWAAEGGQVDVARLLIEKGANPAGYNGTAIDGAVFHDQQAMIAFLNQHGVTRDPAKDYGRHNDNCKCRLWRR